MKKTIKYTMVASYFIGMFFFFAGISVMLTACNDELEVQQVYPFSVTTMPVQKKIKVGETAEIRVQLHRDGYFDETEFSIRYFQPDGKGELTMSDGTAFLPNDRYPIPGETFRLYYTSASSDQQTIDIYIEDNHGQVVQLSFSFNNDSGEDD